MAHNKILIVDDDPDIRDVLKLILSGEGYDVYEASNGEEALIRLYKEPPELMIVDYKMPGISGGEVCKKIKADILLAHIPIIMLTARGEVQDKVRGIDEGADDYMVKPFEPVELLARVKMIMRRSSRDLDANPLTRLPGNKAILDEISVRIKNNKEFALYYIDLDNFKIFNDIHGFERGDRAIMMTANIVKEAVGELGGQESFIGHIGGDDFVAITLPDKVRAVSERIIVGLQNVVSDLYDKEDKKRGYIIGKDRSGKEEKVRLISVSIGVAVRKKGSPLDIADMGRAATKLKEEAKSKQGNNYMIG
ncbi:MAG: hypothetical protein AUJ75_02655 [Candidatus Omnitrophica bacterium CG1_02_49_10]|nr:MAG: hypothetical protein AUJ75_02655 [Candidatus Omnitrophica bacterium CG1_02_49_10]